MYLSVASRGTKTRERCKYCKYTVLFAKLMRDREQIIESKFKKTFER